jgi:two-component system sensor kinase FixL
MPITPAVIALPSAVTAAALAAAAALALFARGRGRRTCQSDPAADAGTALGGPQASGGGPVPDPMAAYLDGVAAGVIVGDRQGNLIYWNPAALRLHGFATLAEVRKHLSTFLAIFTLEYAAGGGVVPFDQWPMARLLRGEAVPACELMLARTDTGGRWVVRYTGTTVRAGGVGDERFVLTLDDVTPQRQAERELRHSQSHMLGLMESLPQLVWTCRADDGACDYLSPQFLAYTGRPAADQLGYGWVSAVHPDDRHQATEAWQRASTAEQPLDVEFRLRRSDGAYRWFKTRAVPLRDAGGRVSKWIGTNTDIHDERTAGEAAAVLAAIVEHSDDAIVGKTLDGTMTSWNRAAERVFGYRADEAVGRNVTMLLPPDRVDEERDILRRLTGGQSVEHFESRRRTKDGRLIDVALTISPVRDAAGRVVGASKIARDVTAAKRDALALRDSEARFRQLAAAVPQIVWTSGPDGRPTYLNERWAKYTGLLSAGADDMARVVHPDDAAAVAAAWGTARAAGEAYQVEFRLRPADGGDYRWFLARAEPVRDAGGTIVEWFGTSTDIDELKRVEAQARHAEALALDNEARLRAVLDGAVDGIVTIDERGTIESINPAVVVTFGYAAAEVVGRNVNVLMPDPYAGEHDGYLANYRATGERKVIGIGRELIGRRKDGSTFPLDLSVSEVRLGGRRIFTGIVRDVTARKCAERALLDSERHLRGVLDGLLVYVAVLRPGGRLAGMNAAARQALASRGLRAEDVEGRAFFDLPLPGVTNEARGTLRAAVAEAAAGREVRLDGVCLSAGPPRVVVDLMLAPMADDAGRGRDAGGSPGRGRHLIVSAVDVTARERADQRARDRQAELAHLERLRTMGQMAAGLAHELNQPLGAIVNFAGAGRRLSAAGRLGPDRLDAVLADVQAEATRAGAIIGRLRGFVKKQAPQTAPVDVNALVADAVRLLAFDLRKAGVEPRLALAAGLPPALADPVQIGQVLVNLVRNALDAMEAVEPDRRVLTIETSVAPGNDYVKVAVRDGGCGVTPDDLAKIFDAFYTTKPGGLGVGLALCRTIVEDHGGHLAAEPNAGGGMTFAFMLRPAA